MVLLLVGCTHKAAKNEENNSEQYTDAYFETKFLEECRQGSHPSCMNFITVTSPMKPGSPGYDIVQSICEKKPSKWHELGDANRACYSLGAGHAALGQNEFLVKFFEIGCKRGDEGSCYELTKEMKDSSWRDKVAQSLHGICGELATLCRFLYRFQIHNGQTELGFKNLTTDCELGDALSCVAMARELAEVQPNSQNIDRYLATACQREHEVACEELKARGIEIKPVKWIHVK